MRARSEEERSVTKRREDETKRKRDEGTNSFALLREIRELSNEDVDEYLQIVGVEVFLRPRRGEEEVEDLEDEKLHAEILRRRL